MRKVNQKNNIFLQGVLVLWTENDIPNKILVLGILVYSEMPSLTSRQTDVNSLSRICTSSCTAIFIPICIYMYKFMLI